MLRSTLDKLSCIVGLYCDSVAEAAVDELGFSGVRSFSVGLAGLFSDLVSVADLGVDNSCLCELVRYKWLSLREMSSI